MQLLWKNRVTTSWDENFRLFIFDSLFEIIVELSHGGIPFEALLGLLVLEEFAPVGLILELFVVLG